jgi:hypothetical protein
MYAWKINEKKAMASNLILAVDKGEIVGVYHIKYIKPNKKDIRRKNVYVTKATPAEIRNYYGSMIPNKFRKPGMRSPLLYTYF